MALLLLDSFDHYTTAQIEQKWTAGGGSIVPATHGNGVFTPRMRMGLAPGDSTLICGASIKFLSLSSNFFIPIDNAFAPLFKESVISNTDGSFRISTSLSAADIIKTGGTYYCWLKATNLNSSSLGTMTLYVEGIEVLAVTGIDMMNGFTGSALGWTGFQIGRFSPNIIVDDLIVMDGVDAGDGFNDVLLDGSGVPTAIEIVVKRTNAAGDLADWNPVPGVPNWENVDDLTPDGDATYNYALSTQVSPRDLYHCEDLAPDESILGAQLLVNARRNGNGAALIAPLTKQDATVRVGTTIGTALDYAYVARVPFGAAPDGSAWTRAIFNAIQAGQQRIS